MALILSKYVPVFLYPLGFSLILVAICLVSLWGPGFARRKRRIALLLFVCLVTLWTAACPVVANRLISGLEGRYVSEAAADYPAAGTIVVLSGGVACQQSGGRTVLPGRAFDRLYLGYLLYRAKKAPRIILSGGGVIWEQEPGALSESQRMFLLARQLGVPEKHLVIESHSRNTRENAWFTREILRDRGWDNTVLLVTSAFHMHRARACFEKLGMKVIPCPADFKHDPYGMPKGLDYLPGAAALDRTTIAVKEYIGWGYYRLRGWL